MILMFILNITANWWEITLTTPPTGGLLKHFLIKILSEKKLHYKVAYYRSSLFVKNTSFIEICAPISP